MVYLYLERGKDSVTLTSPKETQLTQYHPSA